MVNIKFVILDLLIENAADDDDDDADADAADDDDDERSRFLLGLAISHAVRHGSCVRHSPWIV